MQLASNPYGRQRHLSELITKRVYNRSVVSKRPPYKSGLFVLVVSAVMLAGFLTLNGVSAQSPGTTARSQSAQPSAQTSNISAQPSFEVVSIKRHATDSGGSAGCGQDLSRCTFNNATAKGLILFAFGMRDYQVSGGPRWINSELFDVDAKISDAIVRQLQTLPRSERTAEDRSMFQSLLADRFKLSVTHATKQLPAFALVVGDKGSKLVEARPDALGTRSQSANGPGRSGRTGMQSVPPGEAFIVAGANGKSTIRGKSAPLSQLAALLSLQLGHQIIDQTGITGNYDFQMSWTPDSTREANMVIVNGAPPHSDADAPEPGDASIFTAIQEQLGLRLKSIKAPTDTIVIDHIEEPTPN